MFGLTITTKREMALFAGTIGDLRAEKAALQDLVDHERARAEAMLNLLLIKTQQAAITPGDKLSLKQQEDLEEKMESKMDIFGDGKIQTEEEFLREAQGE